MVWTRYNVVYKLLMVTALPMWFVFNIPGIFLVALYTHGKKYDKDSIVGTIYMVSALFWIFTLPLTAFIFSEKGN